MNLLFVFNISFDGNETSIHLLKDVLIKSLDRGHNCHVICKKTDLSRPSALDELKNKYSLSIDTVFEDSVKKGGFIKRYLKEYNYAKKCKKLYKNKKFDAVFVQSCNAPHFHVNRLKCLKCPIVFNAQDIFPQNLYFSNQLPLAKITYPIFRRLRLLAYKKVDKIITISTDMRKTLIEQGVSKDKIEVVYNWSYGDGLILPENIKEENFYDLGVDKSKLNVVYAGNIGRMQNVEFIATTAKEYPKDDGIHYYIIGNGANKNNVLSIVDGLDNVTVLDMQASNYAESIYAQADVNVIPLVKGGIKTALPSKTATVLRTNSYVVFCIDKNSEFEEFIKNSKNVYVCDIESPNSLYETLKEIKTKEKAETDDKLLNAFSKNNSEKYVDILENLKR